MAVADTYIMTSASQGWLGKTHGLPGVRYISCCLGRVAKSGGERSRHNNDPPAGGPNERRENAIERPSNRKAATLPNTVHLVRAVPSTRSSPRNMTPRCPHMRALYPKTSEPEAETFPHHDCVVTRRGGGSHEKSGIARRAGAARTSGWSDASERPERRERAAGAARARGGARGDH